MKIEKFICVFVISLLVISSIVLAESEGVPKWVVNKLDKHDKDIDKLTKDIEKIWKELTWVTKKLTQHSKEIYNLTKKTLHLQEQINKLKEQYSELKELINKLDECPSDMVKVSGYFIDKDENSENTWFRQVALCASEDKRLCSPSEWHGACNVSLNRLDDMTDDLEWVDSLSVSNAAHAIGGSSCESVDSSDRKEKFVARCCK